MWNPWCGSRSCSMRTASPSLARACSCARKPSPTGRRRRFLFPRNSGQRGALTERTAADSAHSLGTALGRCGKNVARKAAAAVPAQKKRGHGARVSLPANRSVYADSRIDSASTSGAFTRCSLRNQTCSSFVRSTSLTTRSLVPSSPSLSARSASSRQSVMMI